MKEADERLGGRDVGLGNSDFFCGYNKAVKELNTPSDTTENNSICL